MSHYYPPPPGVSRPPPPPPPSSLPARPPTQGEWQPNSYRPSSGPGGGGGGDGGRGGRDRDRDHKDNGRSRHRGGRNRDRDTDRDRNGNSYEARRFGAQDQHSPRRNDHYGPGAGQSGPAPPRGEFTFRVDKPAGMYEAQQRGDHYAPRDGPFGGGRDGGRDRRGGGRSGGNDRRGDGRNNGRRDNRRDRFGRPRGGGEGGGRYAGRFANNRFLAANRPILQQTQGSDVTQNFVKGNEGTTYLNLDELSDSNDEEMDISGDDEDNDNEGEGAPPRKRARTAPKAADEPPKWSNPDPYTVLPPTEVQGGKKKDVVHLIRKARVKAERAGASLLADTEEFISCDMDSDEDEEAEEEEEDEEEQEDGEEDGHGEQGDGGRHGTDGSGKRENANGDKRAREDDRDASANNKRSKNNNNNSHTSNDSLPPHDAPKGPRAQQAASSPSTTVIGTIAVASAASTSTRKGKLADRDQLNPSRKRTHDDQLKPLVLPDHATLKPANKMPAAGIVDVVWRVKAHEQPCPWLRDHSDTTHMGVWLHKEIVDFYNYVKPQRFEQELRQALLDGLEKAVRRRFPNGRVQCFGSFMSGLYLPTGDMDVVMCSTQYLNNGPPLFSRRNHMYKLSGYLCNNNIAEREHLVHIAHAKVPLVQYIDKRTGLKVDLSFENTNGVTANATFAEWKKKFPEMPILVTLLKQFLKMRGLNEPVNGGIGGFSVICLVVSMLQLMPPLQTGDVEGRDHLGDLLMHFFDLYGNKFDFENTAISLDPPGYVPKNKVRLFTYKNTDRLSIIDPNNPANDISGGSKNTLAIMRVFSEAFDALQARMMELSKLPVAERANQSILSVILEGDYSTYRNQREYLREVYVRTYQTEPSE